MTKAIVVYMPVIHQGYISLIERHYPADIILITADFCKGIDKDIADRLSRDMRCVDTSDVVSYLRNKLPGLQIVVLEELKYLDRFSKLIMPDDDISQAIKAKLPEAEIIFDNQFLRWDWSQTNIPKSVTGSQFPIVSDELSRFFMAQAELQSGGSSDWWRRVGAVVPYGDNKSLTAFNKHMPTNDTPYTYGDPRLNMKPGEKPDICSAIHAEALIISTAAKMKDVSLEGSSIYVTTFPCPVCARMIVESGIKKVFFKEGYSILDAADILVYAGVEIFQVK